MARQDRLGGDQGRGEREIKLGEVHLRRRRGGHFRERHILQLSARIVISQDRREGIPVFRSIGLAGNCHYAGPSSDSGAGQFSHSATRHAGAGCERAEHDVDAGMHAVHRHALAAWHVVAPPRAVADEPADPRRRAERERVRAEVARRYTDELLPLRRQISEEVLFRYNGMLASVFELLVAV